MATKISAYKNLGPRVERSHQSGWCSIRLPHPPEQFALILFPMLEEDDRKLSR